ncbi:MAG: hypothetical protein HY330_00550 [Chloroflexi bacterium]|nr:hypothetical protein [Chloroflexota bacterium]
MSETDAIYNRYGTPVYRVLDDGRIVDFPGHSRGWLRGRYIYDYQGAQRGSYEGGLFRTSDGSVAGYGENPASPHPTLPARSARPAPAPVEPEPPRPAPASPTALGAPSPAWSATALEEML